MSEKDAPINSEEQEQAGSQLASESAEEQGAENTDNEHSEAETTVDLTEKLQEEVKDLKDQNLRLFAEFENFRKRTAKERLDLLASANRETLAALLPVLDDFDRALKNIEENDHNKDVLDGVKLIQHKLHETLKNKGLVAMESAVGKPFDLETMEAITQIPAPSEDMEGKVIDEVEKGYTIGEKVLRYTKVVVAKKPE